jgi:hypothetical protein
MAAVERGRDDDENDADRHEHDRAPAGDERSDRQGEQQRREAQAPQEGGRIRGGIKGRRGRARHGRLDVREQRKTGSGFRAAT